MIIVQLTGGLGNQLFQYAIGRALSSMSKEDLYLDISSYSWDNIREFSLSSLLINAKIASVDDIIKTKHSRDSIKYRIFYKLTKQELPYYRKSVLIEPFFNFDPNFPRYRSKDVYMIGYWQSEFYFDFIRSTLLKEITLCNYSTSFQTYNELIISSKNSVSIHVRRGDYLTNPHTNSYHGLCSNNYYYKAIEEIYKLMEKPQFYVFSDDINCVKEIFKDYEDFYFIENLNLDVEELLLMSKCKHNIIANSTFSWWAAWLNQNEIKEVFAPKKWFKDVTMQNQTDSLIPKKWRRI